MRTESNPLVDAALAGIGALTALSAALILPAHALAALLGRPAPTLSPVEAWRVLTALGDPGSVLGTPIPTGLYWAAVALVLAILVTVATLVIRQVTDQKRENGDDPHDMPGLAATAVIRDRLSPRALTKRGRIYRPSLTRPRPHEVGYRIGISRGIPVWIPVEHSVLLIGPARQGKGLFVVLRMICEAPGAVLSTSLRAENMDQTLDHRSGTGPIGVFAPEGLDSLGSAGDRVRDQMTAWSLTGGCTAPAIAQRRARALAANAGKGVENATFWQKKCEQAIAPMLMAAELSGGGTEAVFQWAQRPALAREAVDILSSHLAAPDGWAGALDSS